VPVCTASCRLPTQTLSRMCRVDEFEDIGPYDDSDDERDALIKRNQVGDVLVAQWTARRNTVEEYQAEPTSAGAGPLLGL